MKKINTQKISWNKIDKGISLLEKKLQPLKATIKNIYGMPRGGLVPAVVLSHRLGVPLVVDQRSISKYTVVVDEIVDSGKTMIKLTKKKKTKLVVSLFTRNISTFKPDYTAFFVKKEDYLVFPWESLNKKEIIKDIKKYETTR